MPIVANIGKVLLDAVSGEISDGCDLPNELKLYDKDIDANRLKTELLMLPDLVQVYDDAHPVCTNTKVTCVYTLAKVKNKVPNSKCLFRKCHKLIRIFFNHSITIATAKRSFSALRRLKTFLQSNMS